MTEPESLAPEYPSGRQFRITLGDASATITEVGATLRQYRVGDHDVIHPFAVTEMSDSHGQILIPFPNRIEDGTYTFDGQTQTLPINQPGDHAAIHGLVRYLPWRVEDYDTNAIELEIDLFPSPGYPFTLRASARFELHSDGLHIRYEVTNMGNSALPLGIGTHPYFTVGSETIDDNKLTVPARTMLTTDDNCIPTGTAPVDDTEFDFHRGKRIGDLVLDTAYTDLIRDRHGNAYVVLESADGHRKVKVQLDRDHDYVQIYSSDTLPDPATHRASLAIEPMTCPANAFNTGEGLQVVNAGDTFTSKWAILPSPAS